MMLNFLFWLQCALAVVFFDDIETDYDALYLFRSPQRDVEQRLYIKYNDQYNLKFKLIVVRENCDFDISGVAKTTATGDLEIDEDADGEAYPAVEFSGNSSNFDIFIRIAQDKEKAKIITSHKGDNTNSCNFVDQQLMYSE